MFFEFVQAVVTLDFNWLLWIFSSNLHYIFAFIAVCFFFFGPSAKKTVVSMVLLFLVLWVWADFELLSGWGIFIASFLSLFYITKIAVLIFCEDVPALRSNLVVISTLHGIVLIIIFNLFFI